MHRLLCALTILMFATSAAAEDAPEPKCADAAFSHMDFWLGTWNLTWGKDKHATNRITKTLDGCVVQENFDGAADAKLVGLSVSTYDVRMTRWRQTWVDNSGGYFDLVGGLEGDDFVLTAAGTEEGPPRYRMIFTNIEADSLNWLWQGSKDGGPWKTAWELHYTRAKN